MSRHFSTWVCIVRAVIHINEIDRISGIFGDVTALHPGLIAISGGDEADN
ncbi:hypothetical protein [Ruegeria sp. ANG-S4]|nr:hypothetical protein [Ruegeria sp. ANG-S4]